MKIPTLKKTLINKLYDFSTIEDLNKNQIYLYTPIGIISGEVYEFPENYEEEKTVVDVLAKNFSEIADDYKEKYNIEDFLPNNDGFIVLKKAKIQPLGSMSTTNIDLLTVFFDQIIAVSFGTLNVAD
ncbi:MAG: hypothetical protein SA378_08780 [Sedimentibacter sp.]|uniref:hypothetical protein n=1 Tax=Sedimentibacter sp. TaxID=1960295 RepID=UPI002980DB14|nr:hypothetical protein [Sedimentibacter sp.]MDW5300216.1 hypothetical protein [Sedimentibacter sp.]